VAFKSELTLADKEKLTLADNNAANAPD